MNEHIEDIPTNIRELEEKGKNQTVLDKAISIIEKDLSEEPKMCLFVDIERVPRIFKRVLEIVKDESKGYLFVAFHMGSVRLDISNVNNILEISDDYIEIFNAENGETSLIKTDEVTGFIFEPDHVCTYEDGECECGDVE